MVRRLLPRARREPVGGRRDHRHERGDRRAAGAADGARALARPVPRARVPARGQPLHGRAAARRADRRSARRRPPPVGGRSDGGARSDRVVPQRPPASAAVEPGAGADDGARRGPAGVRAATSGIGPLTLPWQCAGERARRGPARRFRRPPGPGPCAARPRWRTTCPR